MCEIMGVQICTGPTRRRNLCTRGLPDDLLWAGNDGCVRFTSAKFENHYEDASTAESARIQRELFRRNVVLSRKCSRHSELTISPKHKLN
jgi:hypothetical protein